MGSKAGLDDVEKRKFLTLPGLELRPSVVQPVASRYTPELTRFLVLLRVGITNLKNVITSNGLIFISTFIKPVKKLLVLNGHVVVVEAYH
jgi:hypothetical protein